MNKPISFLLLLFLFLPFLNRNAVASDVCDNFYLYERDQCTMNYPDQTDWHYSLCMQTAADDYIACKPTESMPTCFVEDPMGSGYAFTYCNVSLLMPRDKKHLKYFQSVTGKLNYEQMYGSKRRQTLNTVFPLLREPPFINSTI